jgi:hypothetical protein
MAWSKRGPKDGELYGFEGTQAISTRNASQIAATARQFGQEDDITVVTLRRLRAWEPSTAQYSARVSSPHSS